MPARLLEATEIADRVAQQMGREAVIDGPALQQAATDARMLMSTDAANAHAVLGQVAALRWDVAGLRWHFRSAISLGDPVLSRWRYSTALFLVGETEESDEEAHDACRRAPDNLGLLDELVTTTVNATRFHQAQEFCDRYRQLAPKQEFPLAAAIQDLVKAVQQGHFSEDGACEKLETADSFRRDARVLPSRNIVTPSQLEPGSFLFECRLVTSPNKAGS